MDLTNKRGQTLIPKNTKNNKNMKEKSLNRFQDENLRHDNNKTLATHYVDPQIDTNGEQTNLNKNREL